MWNPLNSGQARYERRKERLQREFSGKSRWRETIILIIVLLIILGALSIFYYLR